MKNSVITVVIMSLLSGYSCSSKQSVSPTVNVKRADLLFTEGACGNENRVVKRVMRETGTVNYIARLNKYAIVVYVPDTFDSHDVGLVCNLPAEVQVNGLKVTFDGIYREYDQKNPAIAGGETYYYLVVNSLSYNPDEL